MQKKTIKQISRIRTKKRYIKNNKNKKTRHSRKGGNNEKVKCCMCEKMVNKDETFIPRACLVKHGNKLAHRICKVCWWNPETGFARENAQHNCPGCFKGIPLTTFTKISPIIVDLTEESV